jgi:hypothetical protein
MTRFNQVQYSAVSQTAVVGAGLIWDDVYAALESRGVSVVGGRVSGVGVAGFTLGGGELRSVLTHDLFDGRAEGDGLTNHTLIRLFLEIEPVWTYD